MELAARKGIEYISKKLSRDGIELIDSTFERVSLSFPPSLSVKDFSARVMLTQKNALQVENDFSLTIQSAGVSLLDIMKGEFAFNIEGAVLVMRPRLISPRESASRLSKQDKLTVSYFTVPFKINIFDIKNTVIDTNYLLKSLAKFAKDGVTNLDIAMSGFSEFIVRDIYVKGRLRLAPYGKDKKLVMDVNDFQKISEVLGEKLTKYEFAVYCENPLRMPKMLRIRDYASSQAWEEHKINEKVPEEAYKHILWAYLLTLAYDEQFSTETTDSHEIDPAGRTELKVRTYYQAETGRTDPVEYSEHPEDPKTEREIQQDLINNAIGRKYARNGYPEDRLLERTMSDPDVVRSIYDETFSDSVKSTDLNELRTSLDKHVSELR